MSPPHVFSCLEARPRCQPPPAARRPRAPCPRAAVDRDTARPVDRPTSGGKPSTKEHTGQRQGQGAGSGRSLGSSGRGGSCGSRGGSKSRVSSSESLGSSLCSSPTPPAVRAAKRTPFSQKSNVALAFIGTQGPRMGGSQKQIGFLFFFFNQGKDECGQEIYQYFQKRGFCTHILMGWNSCHSRASLRVPSPAALHCCPALSARSAPCTVVVWPVPLRRDDSGLQAPRAGGPWPESSPVSSLLHSVTQRRS